MTLSQIASVLMVALVVGPLVLFLQTGDLRIGMLLLAAPFPLLVLDLFGREWADWTIRDLLQRGQGDDDVEAGLHRAIRGPEAPVRHPDDAYFIPGCPPLGEPPADTSDAPTP